jgi:phenylacetic acid degradation operon negative regulatory protein
MVHRQPIGESFWRWHHGTVAEFPDVEAVWRESDTSSGATTGMDLRRRGPLRGPSARAYLVMMLGLYVLDQDDAAWTKTFIDALGLVGFEQKAARQALTRSAAGGWLTQIRDGRRVRWNLTPRGREFLRSAEARLFATGPERDWDGDWLVLLTSVPEKHRMLRHALRTSLGWAGFGSLGAGVWISPHPSRADEARQVLGSLGDQVQGTLLHSRLDDPADRQRLAAQAWEVSELDAHYRAFIDRFAAARPDTPGDTLAQQVHMFYEWRRLLLADPGLPPTLLPPDWSGEHARRLFLDRHAAWNRPAHTWWRASETEIGTPHS